MSNSNSSCSNTSGWLLVSQDNKCNESSPSEGRTSPQIRYSINQQSGNNLYIKGDMSNETQTDIADHLIIWVNMKKDVFKNLTTTPTEAPSTLPTKTPSKTPTEAPSELPSAMPSKQPTEQPTEQPTGQPTVLPTSPLLTTQIIVITESPGTTPFMERDGSNSDIEQTFSQSS